MMTVLGGLFFVTQVKIRKFLRLYVRQKFEESSRGKRGWFYFTASSSDFFASPRSLTCCSGKARNAVSLYPLKETFIILFTLLRLVNVNSPRSSVVVSVTNTESGRE